MYVVTKSTNDFATANVVVKETRKLHIPGIDRSPEYYNFQ